MLHPARYSAVEKLADGRTVTIRSQSPGDREGWLKAIARVSSESLYHRFFAIRKEFSQQEMHFFLDVDFVKHVALVAETEENGNPTLIGGCRYIMIEPGKAEVAFGVIDDYQHKGIGSILMRHLGALAKQAGLTELVAEVLADNASMLGVFEHSGLPLTLKAEGTVIHVSIRIPQAPA